MESFISTKKELFNLPEIITSESGYLINEYKDLSLIANGLFSIDNKNLRKVNNLRCADVSIVFDENTYMVSMSCQTVGADIYYTLDGSGPDSSKTIYNEPILINDSCTIKAVAMRDGLEPSDIVSETMVFGVGDTVFVDGIETLIIADLGEGAENGRYIGVDKNHDLSYYISGDDYVNQELPVESAKYGYEYGGYGIKVNTLSNQIGNGINNTNSLIAMNLQPETANWNVLWNKVNEFRQNYSNNWFVPNQSEAALIINYKNELNNLTKSGSVYYHTTEQPSYEGEYYFTSYYFTNNGGFSNSRSKARHDIRTRLCIQFNASDIDNEDINMIKKNV